MNLDKLTVITKNVTTAIRVVGGAGLLYFTIKNGSKGD